ncbi:hypothetical protein WOLCODRAFT_15258 [Wolfiporia cocos MD-104 SS10]|uniref:Uncharacterized protein n=1 Tax=Wolfiporia cocos (strain MD-104) TaxID=742152 RepID=A0A2H3IWG5_WOLCO|nr:hypothetical protein WOLCODRAFT_15258 [Wolfiporia cocos MD-104 SS10]
MYPRKWITRLLVIGTFLACAAAMIVELVKIEHSLGTDDNTDCAVPGSDDLWKVFIPVLVVHTVLFIATTWPAMRVDGHTSLLGRLARDGCVLYVLVFMDALISHDFLEHNRRYQNEITIGETSLDLGKAVLNSNLITKDHEFWRLLEVPAHLLSSLITIVPTICISHIMLNVRSMAASLNVHSDMLLSTAELSRLQWRPGTRAGEIVVDVDTVEDDNEAPRMPCTTRLGEIEMTGMPGVEDSQRMIDRALGAKPYGASSNDSEEGSVLSMP